MHVPPVALLIVAILLGAARAQDADTDGDSLPRPIIAQLYAEPESFMGRPLAVYGLVVEASANGTVFMLQDVSQHPLKVVGKPALTAAAGDQVTIVGILQRDVGGPYLAASLIIPTRVLGGGGCC
jgi:hypothetical protein